MGRSWKCLLVLLMLDFAVFLRPASTTEEETGSGDFDEDDDEVDDDDVEDDDFEEIGIKDDRDMEEDEEEDDDDDDDDENYGESGSYPVEEDNEGGEDGEPDGHHESHEDGGHDGMLGPCAKEVKSIVSKKGDRKLDDIFVPRCTESGWYEPRQCKKEMCWCVTEDGTREEETDHMASENYECRPADIDPSFDHGGVELASQINPSRNASSSSNHPAFLAAIVIMVVMGLAGAVLVAMFVVYRMRKKDEGSYALAHNSNSTAPERRSTRSLIFGGQGGAGGKEIHSHQQQPEPSFYSLQPQLQQALQQQEFYA